MKPPEGLPPNDTPTTYGVARACLVFGFGMGVLVGAMLAALVWYLVA